MNRSERFIAALCIACFVTTISHQYVKVNNEIQPDTINDAAKRRETCASLITNEPNTVIYTNGPAFSIDADGRITTGTTNIQFEFTYPTNDDFNIGSASIFADNMGDLTIEGGVYTNIHLTLNDQPTTLTWSNGSYHLPKIPKLESELRYTEWVTKRAFMTNETARKNYRLQNPQHP